jgi:hypothetical protein
MRKTLVILTGLLLLYLARWPVPIEPERWGLSPTPGFAGVYAPNTYLSRAERIDLPDGEGPGNTSPWGDWLYPGSLEAAALGRVAVP